MDFQHLIVVSTTSGYVVHRLIATRGDVPIYTAVGAAWDTLDSAERFADSIAEQEL
jgi:beta-glucosidase-like glycosyl hydrolase